ncbi:NADPH-dependent 7-cyano-7-deazaguanine reductase QueF [Lampropedia puyangensis]|uniref:NADPH-dependent 7-cyano-7-deazaguanine reductase n=1 Tax=Lampropedia puyangensis TaxID=1330072 RepID=A0A4S8EXK5_9BURK|nr:NADPH-dependent 7-cyano-7-deazaguanine reductase QueF [Lampropedia puyangensis]THT99637.1 NADPH-dependent 7-cyano-7-deazaguanine reductase QueF [Lampropedia puyangensis]
MPVTATDLPLGKEVAYPQTYQPQLLCPIPRLAQRQALGIGLDRLPFMGADVWTAFELSWLNARGKPQVAIAHLTFPCETPNIVESKSLKLYLNSLNNSVFADKAAVRDCIRKDLSEAAWRGSPLPTGSIGVRIIEPASFDAEPIHELSGLDLDRLDVECSHYTPQPNLLFSQQEQSHTTETLTSRLLKSNCPVTGQPDWASLQISYSGHPIDQAGLLQYIVSFRNHTGFHENCVEQIFIDIWQRCAPLELSVQARYTRRGGLDINPLRSSKPHALPANIRTARQ